MAASFTMRVTITEQPVYPALLGLPRHEGNMRSVRRSAERADEEQVAEARAKGSPSRPGRKGREVYSGAPVEGRQPVRDTGFKYDCSS